MHPTSRPRACFGVSLLLAAVTGVLSAPILAQEKPVDDSAQGETLSPEASPAKKGVYLSEWFNQDLTLIGSKDISFGPKPTDDVYLEYEYFGRKGPFELYGYIDVPKILADARKAKAAGADVVVLNMHWGTEYQAEPDADQVAQANALTASPDIDIILGGHAHVVQPIQKINNKWVMFGTGNLFGCHRDFGDPDEEGVMGRFTFTEKHGGGFEASNAEYLPILATCTFDGDSRVMNIPVALATADYGAYGRDRLELAQARTTATVDSLGGSGQGLQPLTQ